MSVQKLMLEPYNLAPGTSVFAHVKAMNVMGESEYSTAGNGAVLKLSVVPDAPTNVARDDAFTLGGQATITWQDGASDGGQPIDYYRVSHDQSSDTYVIVASEVATQSYTATDLIPGNTYRFRVEAHNAMGYGTASAAFAVIAATSPDAPSAPTTSFDGSFVKIAWSLPYNGGSAVNGYTVKIRQVDEVTYTEVASCDGSTLTVITNRACQVPIATLTLSPFNLPWGTSVYAIVQARNVIGDSEFSAEGNGSVILVEPDAPVNLVQLLSSSNAFQVGLSWQPGANDGGTPVTSYTVSYDRGNDGASFVEVQTGILETEYTVTGLTAGLTYQFKVQAQNSFGLSDYSIAKSVYTAQAPDAPVNIVTSAIDSSVKIMWSEGLFDGGSPLTATTVQIRQSDGVTYSGSTECPGLPTDHCFIAEASLMGEPWKLTWGDSVFAIV